MWPLQHRCPSGPATCASHAVRHQAARASLLHPAAPRRQGDSPRSPRSTTFLYLRGSAAVVGGASTTTAVLLASAAGQLSDAAPLGCHPPRALRPPFCRLAASRFRSFQGARAGSVLPRSGGTASEDGSGATSGGSGFLRAAVGIDLGTTTSAVAVTGADGRPVVVEDEAGHGVIPSVVFIQQDGTVLVGDEAAAAAESDPANAFYGIKRLMGRSYGEALREIDQELLQEQQQQHGPPGSETASSLASQLQPQRRRLRSYALAEGPSGGVEVVCPALSRNLTPPEVSAHLLRHLVGRARAFLERQCLRAAGPQGGGQAGEQAASSEGGVQVLDAVITVPAHFGPAQRRAVSEAGRAAGLQRVTLLQEPIAAAMAYGFGSPHVPYDVLLVFDLGGGTLDLTVVEAFEGIMEVLSTSGDNYLGGDDFTAAVADWLAGQQSPSSPLSSSSSSASSSSPSPASSSSSPSPASSASSPSPASSASSLALLRAAEAAKLALSEAVSATRGSSNGASGTGGGGGRDGGVSVRVRLPALSAGAGIRGPEATQSAAQAEVELTHGTFEELVRPLIQRVWWPLEQVALTTRTQLGGRLPPHLDPRGSAETAGSGSRAPGGGSAASSSSAWGLSEGPGRREGAAAWEFSIFPPPHSAGGAAKFVATPRRLSGLVLVGAATRLPVVRDYIMEVTGLPVRPGVDPETAVALGAALHAGLMVGSVAGGIEMNDGGYVADQHGRASGFQMATSAGGSGMDADEALLHVWNP